MKKTFEQDLLERANPSLKPSSPKVKNTLLSARNLDLHPSLSAQANQGTSPKHPQTVRNLDLRTTISHEINSFSPHSRERVQSQRDILLKIPVDLYNKDQIYDAVHIFQNPRDKLKMIDLVLERRNQINDRKKRKKLAKAMTLLPEVTGSTTHTYQEPEPGNIINRFRRTMCEIDDQAEQAFQEEDGIQAVSKGTKRKMHLARTQTALKSQSEMSESDDSDSSTDSVKLVFPIEEKGKNLRRRGSILHVKMSGTTPMSMFKFGELNPIAENVTAGPARKVSINDLNIEKRKSLRQRDDQGGNSELAQPILRRKSSFGLVMKPNGKEESPEMMPPAIMKRKGSLNPIIKPKEEAVPEMPALLRRKNSVNIVPGVVAQQQNVESPPIIRRRSSVNLTLAAIVTGKISSSETTQEQQVQVPKQEPQQFGTTSVLIHHPKKTANKSVSLAGSTTEIIKIAKSEPNDQAYSLGGRYLQRDLSRFLLTSKDHSLSQLLLRHSPTMSPKLKQIQIHVKNQYQEITGFKPEKSPTFSSSPFKPENKGLGSPRKLNQLLQKTAGDFAKDFGKKNRSIKQKSVSLIRMMGPDNQLQLTTDPSQEMVQTKRVVVTKRQTYQDMTPKGEKKLFERSPKQAKTVRGYTSIDWTGGTAWKDDFRKSVKVIN